MKPSCQMEISTGDTYDHVLLHPECEFSVQRSTFNIQRTKARRRAQDLSEWQQGPNPRPTGPSGLGRSFNAHLLLISAPHHVTFPSLNMSLDCQYRVFFTCFKVI